MELPGLIRFQEAYFERIWGGNKLAEVLAKPTPEDRVIGEAWMISDHEECESRIVDGDLAGKTLRDLMNKAPAALLGKRAQPTVHGRFPLLLKLLDSAQALSVQVHPDDADALRLNEPDVGKTEMWHVLQADPGSELICGLDPAVQRDNLAAAIGDGTIEDRMTRFEAPADTSVFVAAGTVHAIGGGILLAEIQQNSNLTYRLYDWGRVDDQGNARELHIDKALEVTHFGSTHGGSATPLSYTSGETTRTVLAACRYFAAESVQIQGSYAPTLSGESFHILLSKTGTLTVSAGAEHAVLQPGECVLVPGAQRDYRISGQGVYLDYYVPDLREDILLPLQKAGHSAEAIIGLGGAATTSDLLPLI